MEVADRLEYFRWNQKFRKFMIPSDCINTAVD